MAAGERSKEEVLLKRGLKKSKLFLIQKMTKTIRTLQNKKGSEEQLEKNKRKVHRLIQELEIIKDINLNKLTKRLLSKDEDINSILETKRMPDDSSQRSYWRLLHSKVMTETIRLAMSPEPPAEQCRGSNDERTNNEEKAGTASDNTSDDSDEEESATNEVDRRSKQETKTMFIESLSNGTCTTKRIRKKRPKQNIKRNRMGQRQRREMWESLYGTKARHLTNPKSCPRRKREGQQFIKSQQDRAVSKTAIHPSWEASKRRKALENCEQTFQGKHTREKNPMMLDTQTLIQLTNIKPTPTDNSTPLLKQVCRKVLK